MGPQQLPKVEGHPGPNQWALAGDRVLVGCTQVMGPGPCPGVNSAELAAVRGADHDLLILCPCCSVIYTVRLLEF